MEHDGHADDLSVEYVSRRVLCVCVSFFVFYRPRFEAG